MSRAALTAVVISYRPKGAFSDVGKAFGLVPGALAVRARQRGPFNHDH